MLYDDIDEQNVMLMCPICKKPFYEGRQTKDRKIYIFCKACSSIIAVMTDHSVTNSFDLRKIKEKLQIE